MAVTPSSPPRYGRSAILFNASHDTSAHDCVYHWRGAPGIHCPATHPNCPGLWAVRCGKYKAHWVTKDSIGADTRPKYYLQQPLLYDLENECAARKPSHRQALSPLTHLPEHRTTWRQHLANTCQNTARPG